MKYGTNKLGDYVIYPTKEEVSQPCVTIYKGNHNWEKQVSGMEKP